MVALENKTLVKASQAGLRVVWGSSSKVSLAHQSCSLLHTALSTPEATPASGQAWSSGVQGFWTELALPYLTTLTLSLPGPPTLCRTPVIPTSSDLPAQARPQSMATVRGTQALMVSSRRPTGAGRWTLTSVNVNVTAPR